MSALFWLFGLGALAVAFPFLFHLIRRTPKGQTQFSSLMFLKPTPPSLTRRSRLENLLLLLLRMAALLLIAIAFMRPFLRGSDQLSLDQVANRRIAILVDTSASMQRGDLWQQAKKQVAEVLHELEPGDDVALLAFDDQVRSIVPFDETLNAGSQSATKAVGESLDQLKPGWARSDLGKALVTVADQLTIWRDIRRNQDKLAHAKLQMVVVSDLQKGSQTDRLQSFQWPADVFVEFRTVSPGAVSNATVQVLRPIEETDEPAGQRVRVRNFENSTQEQFFVNWIDADQKQNEHPVPCYVPAGTSRVMEVDDDSTRSAQEFLLSGDSDAFDNSFFVVPTQQQASQIVYLGDDDPDDPEQMQFYLSRGLADTETRSIQISAPKPNESFLENTEIADSVAAPHAVARKNDSPTLVVITAPVDEQRAAQVETYLASGGTLLVVLKNPETVASTQRWTAATLAETSAIPPANRNRYAMLAEIDFKHPLLAPFDSPRFNDFTSIRFWNHQSVEMTAAQDKSKTNIIARFDDGSPAIWQHHPASGGNVIVLSSGWHPNDSQLALSTKFVPLLNGVLNIAMNQPNFKRSYLINEPIEFTSESYDRRIARPDQTQATIEAGKTSFNETDLAGIYRLLSETGEQAYAVNVDRAESETEPIPIEQLEMFSVNVGRQKTAAAEIDQLRLLQDRELEDRQKIWKWLIVTAVVLLIAETWLAGRTAKMGEPSLSIASPELVAVTNSKW